MIQGAMPRACRDQLLQALLHALQFADALFDGLQTRLGALLDALDPLSMPTPARVATAPMPRWGYFEISMTPA
jgi:hypothetical protein